jgi:hypothetical protein
MTPCHTMSNQDPILASLPSRNLKALTQEQAHQFLTDGYTILKNAFDPDTAAAVRNIVWQKIGLSPDHPESWVKPLIHLRESFGGPEIERAFSPRLQHAFDDLMGPGNWVHPHQLGWWPVIFPAKTQGTWAPPQAGWHIDGIQFHHHLTSPDQGLLPIFIFSDCGPDDGGTAFDIGSHKITARILAESEPAGLDVNELCKRVNAHPRTNVTRVIGNAGDVALLHPFINHAVGVNVGTQRVRFICNQCIPLHQPMRLDRPTLADHTLVELATKAALQTQPT